MYYKNIKEFIQSEENIEKLITYDFKNQIGEWIEDNQNNRRIKQEIIKQAKEVENEKNPLKKFKLYKKCEAKFDCDCSNLTNEIYKKIWGCEKDPKYSVTRYTLGTFEEELKKIEGKYQWEKAPFERETMNSFLTTYNTAVLIEARKEPKIELNKYIINKSYDISKILKENPNIQEKIDNNPRIIEFSQLTHSIGNFTILINPNQKEYPKGFNCGRYRKTHDYWDLTLELLKNELDYEIYKKYIEHFILQDFTEKNLKGEYQAKPLFKNHHLNEKRYTPEENKETNSNKPQDETELNEYLENVIKAIKNRGRKMIQILKEKGEI